jgi:type VI secretion system protein ImpH
MGTEGRMDTADLEELTPAERLAKDPTPFGFFQAVRLLEREHPERSPVARFADPANEVARFTVHPSLAFPASEVQAISIEEDEPARLSLNFMGLTGPQGVLPHRYTLTVIERLRARDTTLRDFLDLFHHRLISLFYAAWEKHHFLVAHERDQKDQLGRHLADLIGLIGEEKPAELRVIRREALLYYAGLLMSRQRSALALEQLLEDFFGLPVEVDQFVGAWYPLEEKVRTYVDEEPPPGTAPLGLGSVIGDELWDQQARVRLRFGPLTRKQFDGFLPRGSAHKALRELTRAYGGDGMDFEVQLTLRREDVNPTVLGDGQQIRLGQGTWLKTKPMDHDPDDTILTLQ